MIDPFVLLTPILMLGIMALLGFVGCDTVFGLERDKPEKPTNFTATAGNARVDLSWDSATDADSYTLTRRSEPPLGKPTFTVQKASSSVTTYADEPLTNGTTYFYVLTANSGENKSDPTDEVSAIPTAPLATFITSRGPGTLRNNFTGWVGMAIRVGGSPLTVAELGRFFPTGNAGDHDVKIVDATTGLDLPGGTVSVKTAGGDPDTFHYATLASPITLNANTPYYVVSQETNGADQFFHDDTAVLTTGVASIQTAVFRIGVSPYVPEQTAGHTFGPLNFKYQV